MYAIVHSGEVENGAESFVIKESQEIFRGQAMDDMVKRGIEHVGGRRLPQSRTKKSAEGFYYRKLFRGDKVMECSVLSEVELTAKETLTWEAVSRKVTSCDKAQRKRIDKLE